MQSMFSWSDRNYSLFTIKHEFFDLFCSLQIFQQEFGPCASVFLYRKRMLMWMCTCSNLHERGNHSHNCASLQLYSVNVTFKESQFTRKPYPHSYYGHGKTNSYLLGKCWNFYLLGKFWTLMYFTDLQNKISRLWIHKHNIYP